MAYFLFIAAVTEVISKKWYWFQFTWIFSIIICIWHGYALIKKFWGGGWGEGCLRDTFFARKRRGGAFLYIPWEFEKYDNSAGSDSPAAPPPHPTITCSNFSYTDIRVYLCTLCQNSYNDIPFGLQGSCLEPKTSCWLYLLNKKKIIYITMCRKYMAIFTTWPIKSWKIYKQVDTCKYMYMYAQSFPNACSTTF